ncbi:MAG TPA: MFS transporter [Kineosporiaceae bacterium]|nr:MFS transporter [Kineosporiaceae bacterium]
MSYRLLLNTVHPVFLPLGFLARLPYAMLPLGTLLLIQAATGSYTFAGVAAGSLSLAMALGGLVVGRLAERFGPRPVGALAAILNAGAIIGLIAATQVGRVAMLIAAILIGLVQPQVGPLVRAHWSHVARSTAEPAEFMSTALSYEAAVEETSFIVGPALVGGLAAVHTEIEAAAALAAGAALLVLAAAPFALLYHGRAARPGSPGAVRAPLPAVRLALLVVAMVLMGAIFGALQIAISAAAKESGHPGAAGLLYAELGIGSAVAGVAYAWLSPRWGLHARYLTFAAALWVGMVTLALNGTLLPLPVAAALAGVTIAPYMISIYALTERLAPARVATAMTVLCAGGPVGTAIGQALAGVLTQEYGQRAAFALPPVIATLAVLLAAGTRPPAVAPASSVALSGCPDRSQFAHAFNGGTGGEEQHQVTEQGHRDTRGVR